MNLNIVNNFSPILALKAGFIFKCLDAGLTANSSHYDIPHMTISREMTTSKPGFSNEKLLTWRNVFISGEAYVLVRMLENNQSSYMMFQISNIVTKTKIDVVLNKFGLNIEDLNRFIMFPIAIPYNNSNEYYDEIVSHYPYNVLDSAYWVDYMTPSKDNLIAMEYVRQENLSLLKINPKTDYVYMYIFVNPGVIPKPQMMSYIYGNQLTGKAIETRIFSENIVTTVLKKDKVNDESDND